MSQITISEQAASTLASAAQSRGCTQEELASMLIEEGLSGLDDYQPNAEQQARPLKSYAQAKRGEFIDGDIVMAEFRGVVYDHSLE